MTDGSVTRRWREGLSIDEREEWDMYVERQRKAKLALAIALRQARPQTRRQKARFEITDEYLRQRLVYRPVTGQWWHIVNSRRRQCWKLSDHHDEDGYAYVMIDGRRYFAHRLAWFWMTGKWPNGEVDHKDTNPSNNKWTNLREATCSQNAANAGLRSSNKSGRKGVFWDKQTSKWRALITVQRKSMSLGRFDDIEEAARAYELAAQQYFKEFARAA